MQWKAKTAKVGDRRITRKFAFLPTLSTDKSKYLWLEWYDLIEELEVLPDIWWTSYLEWVRVYEDPKDPKKE